MLTTMTQQNTVGTGRRLGERLALGEVLLSWRVDEVIPGRVRDKPRPPEIGRLIDVSVSGAAIVAPASSDLRPGRPVVIRLDGADAVVRIRRIGDVGDDAWRLYGVEFVDLDLAFRDWINALLDVRRLDARALGWDRAD